MDDWLYLALDVVIILPGTHLNVLKRHIKHIGTISLQN